MGLHQVVAEYSGTDTLASSNNTLTQQVDAVTTQTRLTSNANPSTYGQSVTFTATVSAGATPVTTGTVDITIDGTLVADDAPLNASGQATFATTTLTVGLHQVVAEYSGTDTLASSNNTLTQQVDAVTTQTRLTSNANPSFFAQPVTFTATVSTGGTPVTTGTVDFTVDGTLVADDVPITASGNAGFTTATLAVGSHQVVARYSGTQVLTPSSGAVTQVVVYPIPVNCGPRSGPFQFPWFGWSGGSIPNPLCLYSLAPSYGR